MFDWLHRRCNDKIEFLKNRCDLYEDQINNNINIKNELLQQLEEQKALYNVMALDFEKRIEESKVVIDTLTDQLNELKKICKASKKSNSTNNS